MTDTAPPQTNKLGMPPGSLVHVSDSYPTQTRVRLLSFDAEKTEEAEVSSMQEILEHQKDNKQITWVNIEGLQNIPLLEEIGRHFNIHGLVLEDILNTHQRPKFEDYGDSLFFVLNAFTMDQEELHIHSEQISIVLTRNMVFSFREKSDAMFDAVRTRIMNGRGLIRNSRADYLAYALMDTIVDHYFTLQDRLDDTIDDIEEELLQDPGPETLSRVQQVKRGLIRVRRSVSPLRELLSSLQRSDTPLVSKETALYFRDVFDHVLRISEIMESHRDMIAGMLDIYISGLSNKLNEVMKVLTVFATIFIPLTFLTGVYGMNFEYMPELKWHWAYPAMWVIFIITTIVLLVYFKKKKWL